ncbi:MAG: NAD-dependent epimerase/dehydratase family protein [Sphingobacteriaceae bacterium]|nr:NAD-dependent epimerase/dehydratase family protein [Sphingobacteriaceae bacterium]
MKQTKFNNSKIIVVGGAGFVGSNLCKMILNQNQNNKVVAIDNLMSAEKENLPLDHPDLTFLQGSITDQNILDQMKDDVDYIFHLATYHGNQSSIHNPLADHANNTYTTLRLMEWVKNFKNLKKLVYSSAGCSVAEKTFDTAKATTEQEFTNIKHDSPYSISKIIGEFYSVYYFNQHQLPTVRARFQNVYGPGEVLGAGQWRGTPATVWRNVTPTFIYKAIKGIDLPLENGGIASRDFIYVDDICRGLIACALNGKAGEVYNIATGKDITIAEWANMIVEVAESKSKVELLPKRNWDNSGKRFGSTDKSENEIGFKASIDYREGLTNTIKWTKENISRIESTMKKHEKSLKAL